MAHANAAPVAADWFTALLRCPRCSAGRFAGDSSAARAGVEGAIGSLHCQECGYTVTVRGRVADFSADMVRDDVGVATQASFGYEWTEFSDWRPSGEENCQDYFAGFPLASLGAATVLDAGCGMGRHARFVAPHARHLVAVDFSDAVIQADRNLREEPNVRLLRADLQKLPLQNGSFDFIYSMGVLHHISDTQGTIRRLVGKLRPGGRMRIYVYWSRDGWVGALLRVVSLVRRVTTRLPFPVLKAFCWILSIALTVGVIWPYRVLLRLGANWVHSMPLVVYAKYPFRVLYNDQFDRFSAPLEKRYTAEEARELLLNAGLVDVQVFDRFGWIVEGRKPQ